MEAYISFFCFLYYRARNKEGSRWHGKWKLLQRLASPVQFINIWVFFFFPNYSLEQGNHRINNEILHVPLEVPTYQGFKNPRGLTPDTEPVLPWTPSSRGIWNCSSAVACCRDVRTVCERHRSALPGCLWCSDPCPLHECPHSSSPLHTHRLGRCSPSSGHCASMAGSVEASRNCHVQWKTDKHTQTLSNEHLIPCRVNRC